ncbi:MAG: hypothetical protein K8S16_03815 [Bacteroidales bacterium]|nr:hypothetical protein [Bacteroidales bacterium]
MTEYKPINVSDIVFLGDSLTESFDLLKYFNRTDLINRGMAGNTTEQVGYRLEEIIKAKPLKLFLMIGINDLFNGKSPDEVFEDIKQLVELFHKDSPQSRVYPQSLLPVNESRLLVDEKINILIYQVNNKLKNYCSNYSKIQFLDIHSDFLGMSGQMDPKYTIDGVHLTPAGYGLWANQIRKYLKPITQPGQARKI